MRKLEGKKGKIVGGAVALVIFVLAMLGPVMSLVQSSKTISSSGSIRGIGVGIYQYQNCTSPVSSIDWGMLDPGSNKNVTVYIRNEGNSASNLTMNSADWNPSTASNYITLTWNYTGQTLSVGQVIPVKFTLSVSSSISGITDFSLETTITASG